MSGEAALAHTAALRYPDFRRFQLARLATLVATQMQGVAIGWVVYTLTGRALALGFVGLAQFLPAIVLFPLTGHAADRFDRRHVLAACYGVEALGSAALCVLSSLGAVPVAAIYAVLAVIGAARAFAGPADNALVPNLVERKDIPSAIGWGSSTYQLGIMVGPALGGLLQDARGAAFVFMLALALELAGVACLFSIGTRSRGDTGGSVSFKSVGAGLSYVWRKKVLLGAISLDLFAVLLGGAVALMPIFARDVLQAGPRGLGLLRSAPAVGSAVTALAIAFRPVASRTGKTMFGCVFLFGVATIVFGVSKNLALSAAALAVAGAADMVSVYIRHSLVQLETPDAMRGRVSAVNLLFIGASNELGEFESGVTAAFFGAVPAAVVGGIGTCVVVLAWMALFPDLRRADRLDRIRVEE
ncbi:MAG TPA: MFS transporter [Polyangiaceae bacterium]|nr:MFS transporter [Polyangiaceae bacterium]